MRPCFEGFKIGPLFADDQEAAERLLDRLLATAPEQPVFLDVSEPNVIANRAAEARGMTPSFETARMYSGSRPEIDLEKVWGITTFELGKWLQRETEGIVPCSVYSEWWTPPTSSRWT